MSLLDKWDTDYVRAHKDIGNVAVAAYYFENDPEDSVHMHFIWSKEVDDLIGDSLFEALNHTPVIEKSYINNEQVQFWCKLERSLAVKIAAAIEVDIEIRSFSVAA